MMYCTVRNKSLSRHGFRNLGLGFRGVMKGLLPLRADDDTPRNAKRKREEDRPRLEELLQRYFGHSSFRGLQLDAIEAVLAGKDCFCMMPTGAGKSLCYQIPALAKPGIVLVVSPLIALMEDQVAALKSRQIFAEYLSSSQPVKMRNKIFEELQSGKPNLKLLYVTPESVATNHLMQKLRKLHERSLLSLIAIDEAHCISSWGHDFRPSYRKLSALRTSLPDIPILALTATASKKVQEDIIKSLSLQKAAVLISSFNRANIFYEVRFKDLMKSAYEDLRNIITTAPTRCMIIYCHARAMCDEIGSRLKSDGISCRVYHAGINVKARSQALQDWVLGEVHIIVATIAFGMGIDRKDVRMVCHFNMPKSLESFYQESGRAGRDGKPAKSILYYSVDDKRTMEYVIRSSSQRQQAGISENGENELLKKNIEAFEKVVAYCEEASCRRRRVLEHFGENVSPLLCSKTCDACKWPEKLSRDLKELADASCFNSVWQSGVRIKSDCSSPNDKSEFWNYDNEDVDEHDAEDDISDSEDEKAREAASKGGKKVEKRVAALLRAEEEQKAKQPKKKSAQNNLVTEELRSTSRARLENTVRAAIERLGCADAVNTTAAASALEIECHEKFGKFGRSFYHSQVASKVRWLSACSASELIAFKIS
ncbi:ATP-dependent DNA helicase Q-like 3 [Selaginella moellendorffii]|uniref:ATP-dependent DNA helicase Q-like 3 n=1 Tax=Selaginella moellendorffii TaxID=88036 RepID=UPI000D1C3A4A|nr:ATP-dependent DNA helicase Q-like 3 [Selaginella moellendorffii]|eukprot:XP_024521223.1 ATP-dependent DNA helicase Q-like 3 [Selaginella moellendorffii]